MLLNISLLALEFSLGKTEELIENPGTIIDICKDVTYFTLIELKKREKIDKDNKSNNDSIDLVFTNKNDERDKIALNILQSFFIGQKMTFKINDDKTYCCDLDKSEDGKQPLGVKFRFEDSKDLNYKTENDGYITLCYKKHEINTKNVDTFYVIKNSNVQLDISNDFLKGENLSKIVFTRDEGQNIIFEEIQLTDKEKQEFDLSYKNNKNSYECICCLNIDKLNIYYTEKERDVFNVYVEMKTQKKVSPVILQEIMQLYEKKDIKKESSINKGKDDEEKPDTTATDVPISTEEKPENITEEKPDVISTEEKPENITEETLNSEHKENSGENLQNGNNLTNNEILKETDETIINPQNDDKLEKETDTLVTHEKVSSPLEEESPNAETNVNNETPANAETVISNETPANVEKEIKKKKNKKGSKLFKISIAIMTIVILLSLGLIGVIIYRKKLENNEKDDEI
ncbi:hypothetical protein EHP00_817 [Ecytonucleospora hepatopenaei]|uniref:Uncharacterized protein n=1 Tax=Ecytonucleospora hepatopenaei TaxID=646526 RepID=A0A1W0E816_9MICR|nr:hypothetical protein EHP00_817 [Ecytonucleospora hepatopenaei]